MYNAQIIYTYIHTHHTCRISILYSVFLCNLHSYCMQRCINDPQSEHLTGVSCLSFVNKTTQFQFQCGGLSILTRTSHSCWRILSHSSVFFQCHCLLGHLFLSQRHEANCHQTITNLINVDYCSSPSRPI